MADKIIELLPLIPQCSADFQSVKLAWLQNLSFYSSYQAPEWYKCEVSKRSPDPDLKIKVAVRMDKPMNMKHCGYMYAMGRTVWKKWKRRYFVLVQVSQYTFAICSYKEKKADPSAMMQLDGYTVDYIEPAGGNCT